MSKCVQELRIKIAYLHYWCRKILKIMWKAKPTNIKQMCMFLSWYCIVVLKSSKMFLIKNKQMCSQKVVLFLFKRQRLLSRFKTAFNIAILQTQYASYWSFLLDTFIFKCKTRQKLIHYLYGNILLSSQECNRNYIDH